MLALVLGESPRVVTDRPVPARVSEQQASPWMRDAQHDEAQHDEGVGTTAS
jgi:hypothetical protein